MLRAAAVAVGVAAAWALARRSGHHDKHHQRPERKVVRSRHPRRHREGGVGTGSAGESLLSARTVHVVRVVVRLLQLCLCTDALM